MKRLNTNILLAVILVLVAVCARVLFPYMHVQKYVPIAAIAVFSGAILKDKRSIAFLVPVLGQFLADVYFQFFTNIQGFYPGQLFNYGAIVAATFLGMGMKQPKPLSALAYILGGSTVFFLVSNFGFFVSGWNGYSFAGLVKTYVDAIPFYKYTLQGDLAGGVLLFGSYFIGQQVFLKKLQKAKA